MNSHVNEGYIFDANTFARVMGSSESDGIKKIFFKLYLQCKLGISVDGKSYEEIVKIVARHVMRHSPQISTKSNYTIDPVTFAHVIGGDESDEVKEEFFRLYIDWKVSEYNSNIYLTYKEVVGIIARNAVGNSLVTEVLHSLRGA